MSSGWIKLYRNTLDNPVVCKDADHLVVWIHLLLNATHKPYDIMIGKERYTLQPGQLTTSRRSLSEKTKVSESKVERILKLFKIEHQIEQRSYSTNRIVTILNWSKYQESEQQNEQQLNREWTANEQHLNTNKNVKHKRIEEINNKRIFEEYTSNPLLLEALNAFYEFRNKIKKTMTDRAITLFLNKLDDVAKDDNTKIAIIDQSILNNWQGIYPIKEPNNNFQAFKQRAKPSIPIATSDHLAEKLTEEELQELRELARKLDKRE